MSTVKLKSNMIVNGKLLKFGSVVDLEEIPPKFRKRQWILKEGEIDSNPRAVDEEGPERMSQSFED